MCTLVFGLGVAGEGSLLLAANRDEDPARPAAPPASLRATPPLAGGRDLVAGGTWLAIREDRSVVAVLNRRPAMGGDPGGAGATGAGPATAARRAPSRGLLALSAAAAGAGSPAECAAAARLLLAADPYAPCSLVVAGPRAACVVNHRAPGSTDVVEAAPGWHVVTHEDLDDPDEPRTAWLVRELRGFRPHSAEAGLDHLGALLARHDGGSPPVCLHEGRMVTVSTARVALGAGGPRYLHGEGPACRATLADFTHLIAPAAAPRRNS